MGIFDVFSSGNEEEAARLKSAGLNRGYDLASGLYGQGRDALSTNFARARQPFQELYDEGRGGSQAYYDATGINGAEGVARATEAFQSTPGFRSGFDMGLDELDRRAAARGMLGSGNTNLDTIKFATDYGNKNFGDYVSRLLPVMSQRQTSAAGLAGVDTGLGTALNQSFTGQGGLGFQKEAGIGEANAAAELSKDTTGLNIINAAFGAANLAGKAAGVGGWAPPTYNVYR